MKSIRKVALAGVLALGIAMLCSDVRADDRSEEGASFEGRVSSVDKSAQTIKVDGKTYHLLRTSDIKRNDQSASAGDISAGDEVSGRYKRSAENNLEILSVNITQDSSDAVGGTADTETSEAGASFSGRVGQVKASSRTIRVGGQDYKVLPTTIITRNGQPARFNEIQEGRQVEGRFKKSAEDNLELLSVNVGRSTAMGGAQGRATSEAGANFQGKVSRVNAAQQTFTVGNRTFRVLPTTVITTGSGQPGTLSNLKNDQQVSGSFKRSAEGDLEVLSLHIGRRD